MNAESISGRLLAPGEKSRKLSRYQRWAQSRWRAGSCRSFRGYANETLCSGLALNEFGIFRLVPSEANGGVTQVQDTLGAGRNTHRQICFFVSSMVTSWPLTVLSASGVLSLNIARKQGSLSCLDSLPTHPFAYPPNLVRF